jgi:uncharacterized glyoxalase superfamily protein PhnB
MKAAEFYVRAFGATIAGSHPPDEQGRTMHVHVYVNGGSVMLSDAFPEHGFPSQKPQAFNLMLMVTDVDAAFDRAIAAGAQSVMPVADMFWGDRYGQLRDPFGVLWSMNAPIAGATWRSPNVTEAVSRSVPRGVTADALADCSASSRSASSCTQCS